MSGFRKGMRLLGVVFTGLLIAPFRQGKLPWRKGGRLFTEEREMLFHSCTYESMLNISCVTVYVGI